MIGLKSMHSIKEATAMKDKILFVTKGCEQCDEGSSYALELAKTLHAGIEILIMNASHPETQFEDVMAAAAFAEEGDLKTTKEILESEQIACRKKLEEKINGLIRSSKETAVELSCHLSNGDVSAAIKGHLKNRPDIAMVLLSPSLSENKRSLDIRKLLKNISKPIVHISKPLTAEI
jgi:hypothetical protein